MIKKISIALIVGTILVVNLLRFWQLDKVPHGYNVDEMSGAVSIACLETQGVDAHLNPHPFFLNQFFGTPKPPVYAYPAVLWAKVFGHKVDSFRAFTAFFSVLAILGLFFLGKLLINSSYGLLAALVATVSPWDWNLSRIGYESTFCMAFIIWGIFLFLRSSRWIDTLAAAFLFACAIYVYPPVRLQTPLILLALFAFDLKKNGFRKNLWIGLFAALSILCLPLLHGMTFGHLQERFNGLSILNDEFLKSAGKTKNFFDIAGIFVQNFLLHFQGWYLFTTGDPSWEHSTQRFGLLSWLDTAGLASLLFFLIFKFKETKEYRAWLIFVAVNFLLGIAPASLTNSGLPTSLRTIGAFPFLCLLSGYGLWLLAKRWPLFLPAIACAALLFGFLMLKVYFFEYPGPSKGWFSYWAKEEAEAAKTDEDWVKFMVKYPNQDYHFRYYLMNYHGDSCESSRTKWILMRKMMGLPKVY